MPESDVPNVAGKIIAVRYGSGNDEYAYIEASQFEVQAGRLFLVGTTITTQLANEVEGIRFCVAWERVVAYYEFESLQDCRRCVAGWYPQPKKPRSWFS
jgi:hypothetical protein